MKINTITILLVSMLSMIIGAPNIMQNHLNTESDISELERYKVQLQTIIDANPLLELNVQCPYLEEKVCMGKLALYKQEIHMRNRKRAEKLMEMMCTQKTCYADIWKWDLNFGLSNTTRNTLEIYLDEFVRSNPNCYLPELMRHVLGTSTLQEFDDQKNEEAKIIDNIYRGLPHSI